MSIDIIIRTTLSFLVLLLLTRILGKKQMSQLTYFNYVTGISLGTIAASMIVNDSISLANGVSSLIVWTLLTLLTGFISLKFPKIRVLIDGEPTVVIKNGEILNNSLARLRLNMDDLTMMLRKKNIFSVSDVEYAVFEPNGELSILQKAQNLPVTRKDLNVSVQSPAFIPTEVIVDGEVVNRNLRELNLTNQWLSKELQKQGINNFKEVFYAEVKGDQTLHVAQYKKHPVH